MVTVYAYASIEQRYEAATRGIPWTEGRCGGLLWCVANTIATSWTYTPKAHASAFAAETETPFVSHRPFPGPQGIIHPYAVHHTQTRLPATRCRTQIDPINAYPRKRKHTEKMRGRATKPHCIVQFPHLSFGITIVRTHVLRPSLATRLTRCNRCFIVRQCAAVQSPHQSHGSDLKHKYSSRGVKVSTKYLRRAAK